MNLKKAVTELDHFRGPLDAPVVLVEYGDFECPYCAAAFPMLENLIENFGDALCFVYRHFPLTAIHPHAEFAALAAEAAGRQNQFWEMHHFLFQNSGRLLEENILGMAKNLELNLEQFLGDIDDETLMEKVQNDVFTGARSGVNGTPTLFLNGFRYDGPRNYHALQLMIRSLTDGTEIDLRPS